jgi:hypothetical protein
MGSSSRRYAHHPDVAWRLVQDEALVVDPHTGSIFPLNAVAARLWVLLGEGQALPQVVERLSQEFDAAAETIRADVSAFVAKALQAHLLVERDLASKGP